MADSVFSKYDKNGDGTISCEELGAALEKLLGVKPWFNIFQEVMRKADANRDGKLTKEEFCNLAALFEEINALRAVFVEMDKDRSGTMSFVEMRKKAYTFYTTHADKYDQRKAEYVMNHYCGDPKAEMTEEEFLDIMFKDRC